MPFYAWVDSTRSWVDTTRSGELHSKEHQAVPYRGRKDLEEDDLDNYLPTPTSNSEDFHEVESPRMKLIYFSNEFPHDDLHKLLRLLHQHSKDRRHSILAQFLDEATLAIGDEVRKLPATLQALIPPFRSILDFGDFTDLRRQSSLSESINGMILCTVEIGTFIG